MSEFAGTSDLGDSSEIGSASEVTETDDADYGDGDGVNEFDETCEEMGQEQGTFDYQEFTGHGDCPEADKELSTDEYADRLSEEFGNNVSDCDFGEVPRDIAPNETVINEAENKGGSAEGTREADKGIYFANASYEQGHNQYGYLGTCGPTSIANSLNRVTETNHFTENRVLDTAVKNDLCGKSDILCEAGGTGTGDVVHIIDQVKNPESNIHTEVYEYDKALSTEHLAERLKEPGTVAMVGVDSATLWDERGDVSNSGLFQSADYSDHWITVDSPTYDEAGKLSGFNIIDSGGGVDFADRDKFESMYMGDENHRIKDPTAILITNRGDASDKPSTEKSERGLI